MKVTAISMMLLALAPTGSLGQAFTSDVPRQIYGRVQVVDGTTFEFIKTRQLVRLAGYEAPRLVQSASTGGVTWPVGQVSRAWMILRTLGQNVNCAPIGRDSNKNLIAHCFVGETNLAATAIAEGIGYAFNYPDEPQVLAYFDLERKARGLGFGIWSSPDLSPPWLYNVLPVPDERSGGRTPAAEESLPLPLPVTPDTALSLTQAQGG
ncbi:thermonuclease family protein [Agrobacterium tumefaciens]|jgi:endonuclease YncB( thermonuclease family)|uniref:Nuclease n=1 Tax=Agrobacterium tumefaciens TaxID=358 RepID=A0A4D7Z629_AGRTU|nr:thermonuclease family protein [Agrobacterium tumefaciens]QCL98254.1 nuclease [Agrobacterium tumefaciens]